MISPEFVSWLRELNENNHKEWFDKNKPRFEAQVKKPFEKLVGQIIAELEKIEGNWFLTPKDCIQRIYRDIRFSADKTPYKDHVSAAFAPGGKKNMAYPGYYIEIRGNEWRLYGGAYLIEKEPLHRLRTFIMNNAAEFESLLRDSAFVSKFNEIRGEKNARLDPEFREAAIAQPLLFKKQFYYFCTNPVEECLQPDFLKNLADHFRAAKPVNDFLRQGLV